MLLQLVTTSERPDLAPVVASWLWPEFWHRDGHSYDDTLQAVIKSATSYPMPTTFIALADGLPIGTASLAEHDLDSRRNLSPWLAGVFVDPAVKECRRLSHPVLWLYTQTAESLYAKSGWLTAERFEHRNRPYALMRLKIESYGKTTRQAHLAKVAFPPLFADLCVRLSTGEIN